jgi:hypothetical protein
MDGYVKQSEERIEKITEQFFTEQEGRRNNRVDLHIVLADTRWPLNRSNAGHGHGIVTSRFSILRPIAVDS